MQRISLIIAIVAISSCSTGGPSTSDEALRRVNEVLVSQQVNGEFLEAVGQCPLYENYNYRQIGDAAADALADIENRHFRIVLTSGTNEALIDQYDENIIACVGGLPPNESIWELSATEEDCGPAEGCCLVEDRSDRGERYGISYSSVVMNRLIEEGGCN